MFRLVLVLLAGCVRSPIVDNATDIPSPDGFSSTGWDSETQPGTTSGELDPTTTPSAGTETVPGTDMDLTSLIFDPTTVHVLTITLDDQAIDALRETPTGWVEGDLTFGGRVWSSVGVRIKGSSSFQTIDAKPAWKIEMDSYVDGQRLYGLERLTLNNEVWDPTMMAETMAYDAFRANGSPAPRTGYAAVTLNDRYLGLYAIIETMDDGFVSHYWSGEGGTLWEMTRDCDFTGDCSCFELQEPGEKGVSTAITQGCDAMAQGTLAALEEAFDWDAVLSFLAVERGLNHPDSYTYNLNNFFVYHNPTIDRLSLIPWGADSTFTYLYPPYTPNPNCQPLYLNTLRTSPWGALSSFCYSEPSCRSALETHILDLADWIESSDLVGRMTATSELLDPYAALETEVYWTLADRESRVACFLEWTAQRPDELREWAAAR